MGKQRIVKLMGLLWKFWIRIILLRILVNSSIGGRIQICDGNSSVTDLLNKVCIGKNCKNFVSRSIEGGIVWLCYISVSWKVSSEVRSLRGAESQQKKQL